MSTHLIQFCMKTSFKKIFFGACALTLMAGVYVTPTNSFAASSEELHKKKTHTNHRDPVVFRFSSFGDSRTALNVADITPQDKKWLINSPVLTRIDREIAQYHPNAMVYVGDMVMGYTKDKTQLEREYGYWRGLTSNLLESGTYVFPAPGNHETQIPTKTAEGKTVKLAQADLEQAYRENMADLVIDQDRWQRINPHLTLSAFDPKNTPTAELDGAKSDQSLLTYSFDIEHVHFSIVNTDSVGADSTVSASWLRRDFEAAKARGVKAFVVFGHKMAFEYVPEGSNKRDGDGLEMYPDQRDAFWSVIEEYGATYFCGHQHIFHASQPWKSQGGESWQVIVGSGGAPLNVKPGESKNPKDRMYAWANVTVYASGTLGVKVWGFDAPTARTQLLETWTIKPAKT